MDFLFDLSLTLRYNAELLLTYRFLSYLIMFPIDQLEAGTELIASVLPSVEKLIKTAAANEIQTRDMELGETGHEGPAIY